MVFDQADRVRGAGGVAGVVFCGPPELQQLLLELAPRPGLHRPLGGGAPDSEQRPDPGAARDLGEHRGVGGRDEQFAALTVWARVARDHEPAVASDGLRDVDRDRLRHRELGVALQGREHLLGRVPGGACVPEAEPGDPIGVHVLGGTVQLGENRQVVAGVPGIRVRHLEEHRAVALDDQWPGHNEPVYSPNPSRQAPPGC